MYNETQHSICRNTIRFCCGKPGFSAAFPQGAKQVCRVWKTRDRIIPEWKEKTLLRKAFVKCKEKPSTFFFKKVKMPGFSSRIFRKVPGWITSCIRARTSGCGKPGGKSGKLTEKPRSFFTKPVENPVEKVKSSVRNGKMAHFPVVKQPGNLRPQL